MTTKDTNHAASTAKTTDTGSFGASGAPGVDVDLDTSHPALDADPRAGTTAEQNQIDFNDPTKTSQEAVEDALKGE